MGNVFVVYKLNVEDQERLNQIADEIKNCEKFKPNEVKIEEIGFGIKTLIVSYVFDDKKGNLNSQIEEYLRSIEGVGEVEVKDLTLL